MATLNDGNTYASAFDLLTNFDPELFAGDLRAPGELFAYWFLGAVRQNLSLVV
jgi:hypothetical protein